MKRLEWIDGLRGLFCIWIVLFHYTYRYSEIYNVSLNFKFSNGGSIGVLTFFLLSGYFCAATCNKYYTNGSLNWIWNKFKRLYPQFFIACIFIFIFDNSVLNLRDSISLHALIHNLVLLPYKCPLVDGSHWYVYALVRYYIFFFVVFRFKLQEKNTFWYIIMAIIVLNGVMKRADIFNPFGYFIPTVIDNRMIEGMLLFYLLNTKNLHFAFLYITNGLIIAWTNNPIWAISILLVFPIMIGDKIRLDKLKAILSIKPLMLIGSVSYMWYLCHQNIGYSLINFIHYKYHCNYELTIYMTVLFTFFLAYILDRLTLILVSTFHKVKSNKT